MVHLELLGSGAARLEQQDFLLPPDKRSALLIYLAIRACSVPRTEISNLFWLDTPDFEARRNLRQLLQRVWQLPFGVALARQDGKSRLAAPLEFLGTTDLQQWRLQLQKKDTKALKVNPHLLSHWFLPDAPEFMAWLETERLDLLLLWRTLAIETADQLLMLGDAAQALEILERVLKFEPLSEDALQLLMVASKQNKSITRGVAAFQAFAGVLQRDVGMTPALRTLELLAVLEDRPSQPFVRPETPFFGREEEVGALKQLLENPNTHLLTITGFGGAGKTRLAKEICPHAIWVNLENVTTETGLIGQLSESLGIRFSAHQDAVSQLLNICSAMPKTTLLLDNYEQLLPEIKLVEALLGTGLQLLITSRQALGLRLEQIYGLQGLAIEPAAQLFIERSQRQNNQVQIDLEAVQRIVATLERMPLALELAATWTRTLNLPNLAQELEQNTDLLDWRKVFEGSWRRLTPDLQRKICVLAVCTGGFDLNTARHFAHANLADLAALVSASLLQAEAGRFTMLKLIRHAAIKNLQSEIEVKAAHASYYLQWLAKLEGKLEIEPKNHLEAVRIELENIRAAWNFACEYQQITLLSSASVALSTYLDLRGLFFEAQQLFRIAADASQTNALAHAKLLVRLAWAEFRLGLYHSTLKTLENAQALYTRENDPHGIGICAYQLGNVFEGMGDFTKATQQFEIALGLMQQLEDGAAKARVLNSLGLVSLNSGDAQKAVQYHRESLELRRKSAQPRAMFIAQLNLGDALKNLGQLSQAKQLFAACLSIAQAIGDHFGETLVSSHLADTDRREQKLPQALDGFEQTLKHCQRMGHGYVEVIALRGIGLTLQDLGQLEPAKKMLLQSLKVSLQLEAAPQTNLTLVALTELELENKQYLQAWRIANLVLQRQPAPREQQLLEMILKELRQKIGQETIELPISLEEILPFDFLA